MLPRRAALLLLLIALPGCSLWPPAGGSPAASAGMVVIVTSDGTQLDDGAIDVPPTLDLGVEGDGISLGSVTASLDGRPLALASSANGVSARVAPMTFGSAHHLVVSVAGRPPQQIGFQVVDRTQVSAAAWLSPTGQPVCDAVFELPPDQPALAAALPQARLSWIDPTQVSITWATPPAQLTIPAGLAAARGSVLMGPLTLALTGLHPGQLRRATVPAAPAAPPNLALTLWTVDTAASHTTARQHAAQTAVLSPTGWVAQPDGTLQGSPDAATLAAARAAGRRAWPLLANDPSNPAATDQLLNDPTAEAALVTTLVGQVKSLGLGGINLDFEGVPGDDQNALTAFVRELAAALHAAAAGLSVDVVPHASGAVDAASAAYDYPALAAAANQIVVMAYDQHSAAGDPGPVAGLDWQAEELAGTLANLPRGKVILGIALYARVWSGDQVSASDYTSAIAQALAQPGVAYDYDFAAATPELTSDPGGTPTKLWFDDADSLLRKVAQVEQLGLAGIATWRAGFEDPAFWSVI